MIEICYFSGTGNTKRIVETLNAELTARGKESTLFRIESREEKAETVSDTLIIGYPVYGFNVPKNVKDFANRLPASSSSVYIVKTSGEPLSLNDASSKDLIKILTKKGYRVYGEYHLIMPYNIIFRHTDEMASKMLSFAREKIKSIADDIILQKKHLLSPPFSARLMKAVCSIEYGGLKMNGKLYRINQKTCVKCMKCVRDCPQKNIEYNGSGFVFKNNCIGCMRCAFLCPTDSVRIGILDFLRVNGAYDFSADGNKAVLPKYCGKSYKKYFQE